MEEKFYLQEEDLRKYLKALIETFDKYGDSSILEDEKVPQEVAVKDFKLLEEEVKDITSLFEQIIGGTSPKGVTPFVGSQTVEDIFTVLKDYKGQGVRLPSKGEKLLLTFIIYKYLKEQGYTQKLDIRDIVVLSLLLADILYAGWLYKEGFVSEKALKEYLVDLLKTALSYSKNPAKVKELVVGFLVPTWAGLEERNSIVEKLAQEQLEELATELAKKVLFGNEENFEKTYQIFKQILSDILKEKPKNPDQWVEEEVKKLEKEEETNLDTSKEKEENKSTATEYGSLGVQVSFLEETDKLLKQLNEQFWDKFADAGDSRGLHGFIAEKWHEATFNLDAHIKGKPYIAKALENNTSNSVDLVIKDSSGQIVRRYQAKYYATPQDTAKALEAGDYRGQRPLVPSDQLEEVNKIRLSKGKSPATDRIEYDGVESKPLSLEESKKIKEEIKRRNEIFNWDNVTFKDTAKRLAKDGVKTFAIVMAIKGAWNLGNAFIRKLKGEDVKLSEEFEKLLKEAPETAKEALKATIKGALTLAAKKGLMKFLKNTPARRVTAIVEAGWRTASNFGRWVKGEITFKEFLKQSFVDGVSAWAGIEGATIGASIGATVGSVIPVVGTFVGAIVGGMIGGIAGETIARKVTSYVVDTKENITRNVTVYLADKVVDKIERAVNKVKEFVNDVKVSIKMAGRVLLGGIFG